VFLCNRIYCQVSVCVCVFAYKSNGKVMSLMGLFLLPCFASMNTDLRLHCNNAKLLKLSLNL
jgi:hypothetical protein